MKPPLVFINYRREDSADAVARLYEHLVRRFGEDQIFRDTRAIRAGDVFPDHLNEAARTCRAMLAVIGKRWLSSRLNEPEDWVRKELELAIARGDSVILIPVLIHGVTLPLREALPSSLQSLLDRNEFRLHDDPAFDRDAAALVQELAEGLAVASSRAPTKDWRALLHASRDRPVAVRRALELALKNDVELEAFVQSFADDPRYARVHREWGSDMQRERKVSLLFDYGPPPREIGENLIEFMRFRDT